MINKLFILINLNYIVMILYNCYKNILMAIYNFLDIFMTKLIILVTSLFFNAISIFSFIAHLKLLLIFAYYMEII
jgi:hypothetical protein